MSLTAYSLRLFVVVLPLAGCTSSLPLRVAEFDNEAQFKASSQKSIPYGNPQTFDEVRAAFLAYYNLYLAEADGKRLNAQRANEAGFYSAVIGVIGGIAKSIEVAVGGAVGSAGAGLYGDRYRLGVQAHNYELAAKSLRCMYQLLPGATDTSLSAFRFTTSNRAADIELRDVALTGLTNIRDKLRTLQTSFEFGQADLSKLKQAMQDGKDNAAPNAGSRVNALTTSAIPPVDEIENYRKNIKTCEALMGA